MKLELLTNATVVDDAIRFVTDRSKEKTKTAIDGDKEETKEPDYYEHEDRLEEEQEDGSGQMTTTNEVF
jgi:hypothetical protein